jgi:predicted HicB family RNase H-like nuclease
MSPLNDGTLQIKISNELKEHQYTDIADLMVITHNKNSKAMVDESGYIFTIVNPQQPLSATLNNKRNVLSSIIKSNDDEILYMDDESNTNGSNQLNLKFKIPSKSYNGKLILRVKNSYWLDLLYGKLAEGLGTYYSKYIKQQKKKPAEELNKWINDQQIPLFVSIKTYSGWQQITAIPTIGPLATREMVVSVDLTQIKKEILDVRISSGFMFWEIDYVAMDFSENEKILVQTLSPLKAVDELGRNVLPQLQKEDGKYLVQPDIGNVTTIVYKPKDEEISETTNSYVLKTKGYYEHIRNFTTKPDIKFLNQFKNPNSFPVYGMALHKKVREENLKSLAVAIK